MADKADPYVRIYNKVVRDDMPRRFVRDGYVADIHELTPEEFKVEIVRKIVEEAQEVAAALTRSEIISEMGDVLGVLQAICDAHDIGWHEVVDAAIEKENRRGGFSKRLFLVELSKA